MTDLERLLINLDGIAEHLEGEGAQTLAEIVRETMELLREQESVKPGELHGIWFCGNCGTVVDDKFCPKCGKKVKWDD